MKIRKLPVAVTDWTEMEAPDRRKRSPDAQRLAEKMEADHQLSASGWKPIVRIRAAPIK